ncbi:DMT family transporter [Brevibacillus porteri]|uniref:EamA family transporter n=1 Tax=Brevibacillus porteri TaxID=2126350 RepID=A0ABX5FRL0_9BACL|nr:DMT family transporter [Brevibacillus porteri]MED1798186.1 DMT family transporter [Brevibacillus porteri]MED2131979.1 DMT family transporter [Brevibacillus porteri]MED2746627.1 DMT family transporter [Brevibacillus porteri]MED2816263.1 DMT family transporter [Brevibacillus porteri]MED2893579.1 DMT family transporter [Brevibacillus porteri]
MLHHIRSRIFAAHAISILLWASAFAGIRVGLQAYSPEHLSLLRFLIGSLFLGILVLFFRIRLPELKDVPGILMLGGLGFAVYHTALNYGEMTVGAGVASLLVTTTPIFSALLALLFFREHFGARGWLGALISFLGVAICTIGTGETLQITDGIFLILLAAISESIYFAFQKPFIEKYGVFAFTTYTLWAGTLCMLFFLPGLGIAIAQAPWDMTLSVVYLGIFPSVVAYLSLAYVTSVVGTAEATTSLYMTPVLALLIAWVWLGEDPTLVTMAGGVVTLIGVLLATMKPRLSRRTVKHQAF